MNKAAGPDCITPRTLKIFANELTPIFTELFNISLARETVPKTWKASTIVPVPKKPSPSELNDYRPVALTSVVMKSMERAVLSHLTDVTDTQMDPMQFAYRKARGTDDACAELIYQIFEHLEMQGNYVRLLFVDFSSAFNTMLPSVLVDKLSTMSVSSSLCRWILNYLRDRSQRVRIGNTYSRSINTNIGAPQGCVLSPVLFTHYTDEYRGNSPHSFTIKYADDTAIIGLVNKDADEIHYRRAVEDFVARCDQEGLILNVKKTKEMVIDFQKKQSDKTPLTIKGETIEQCEQYKYLGLTISKNLTWDAHCETSKKKAMKKLYYLRTLKKFRLPPQILEAFYSATIVSTMTYGIVVWGAGTTALCNRKLNRIRNACSRIIGKTVKSLEDIHHERTLKFAKKIIKDPTHPLSSKFSLLPSQRRYRIPKLRTNRLKNSFVCSAIRLLNNSN